MLLGGIPRLWNYYLKSKITFLPLPACVTAEAAHFWGDENKFLEWSMANVIILKLWKGEVTWQCAQWILGAEVAAQSNLEGIPAGNNWKLHFLDWAWSSDPHRSFPAFISKYLPWFRGNSSRKSLKVASPGWDLIFWYSHKFPSFYIQGFALI